MPARPRLAAPAALLALAVLAAPARAQVAAPLEAGGVADLTGPRALGLSAATGIVSGNDGIFVNPGALAARKRYSVETLFAVDRRGGTTVGKYGGASIVDGLSAPVTTSLAWVRPLEGAQGGDLFVGGLAGPLAERLYFGAQARYYSLRDEVAPGVVEHVNAVTADAGLFWELSDYVALGVSGFNLVPSGHERVAPRSAGAGLALGSDTSVKLSLDWRADFDRRRDASGKARTSNRYAIGLETMLGQTVPLRAGFMEDETLGTSWWSAGVGLVTRSGAAVDLGYRQSLKTPDARVIAVSFKLMFLEM